MQPIDNPSTTPLQPLDNHYTTRCLDVITQRYNVTCSQHHRLTTKWRHCLWRHVFAGEDPSSTCKSPPHVRTKSTNHTTNNIHHVTYLSLPSWFLHTVQCNHQVGIPTAEVSVVHGGRWSPWYCACISEWKMTIEMLWMQMVRVIGRGHWSGSLVGSLAGVIGGVIVRKLFNNFFK